MNAVADEDLLPRLNFARSLAGEVGCQIERFRAETAPAFERKGLQDFVTAADRRGEETIRRALKTAFPEDGFLGEETGGRPDTAGFWVVDPIDGTTNFIRGLRHWAVSIAFVRDGVLELGVIYDATTQSVYSAARGGGAWRGEHRIAVATRSDPAEALAILGCSRRTSFEDYQALQRRLNDMGVDYRRLGAAALGLVRVASGVADLFYEAHVNSWDILAGALIASEAGATVEMPPLPVMLERGGPLAAFAPTLAGPLGFVRELVHALT